MKQILRNRLAVAVIAAAAAVGLFAGGMAFAGGEASLVKASGGATTGIKTATNTGGWSTTTTNEWQTVNGMEVQVRVPAGKTRLLVARFNAESICTADAGVQQAWCAARVVAQKASGGSTLEFRPRSGTQFAIDSGDLAEQWEGNSMTRSLRLGAGTWNVWVEGRIQAFDTISGGFNLGDLHLEVESFR